MNDEREAALIFHRIENMSTWPVRKAQAVSFASVGLVVFRRMSFKPFPAQEELPRQQFGAEHGRPKVPHVHRFLAGPKRVELVPRLAHTLLALDVRV